MTLIEWRASLAEAEPPEGLTPALAALWRDAKGDWDGAHDFAQGERLRLTGLRAAGHSP